VLAGLCVIGLVALAAANSRKPERDFIVHELSKT
jgi:hypothetical protein